MLSNTYKGLLESTCIFEPKYTTSIRSLFDAQNLTLYVGIEPSFRFGKGENISCKEVQLTAPAAVVGNEDGKTAADESLNITTVRYLFWKKACRSKRVRATQLDGRHPCVLFETLIVLGLCRKPRNSITSQHCTAYDNMHKRVNLLCMEDLAKIAATRLS